MKSMMKGRSVAGQLLGILVLTITCFALSVTECPGSSAYNVELVGALGGQSGGMWVEGSYAYYCQGQCLVVLDVSDPSTPAVIGKVILPARPGNVHVSGSYAYVTAGSTGGFRVIDVSDPSTPVEVGQCDTRTGGSDVQVSGSYAFMTAGYRGLIVLDVSTPSAPFVEGDKRYL